MLARCLLGLSVCTLVGACDAAASTSAPDRVGTDSSTGERTTVLVELFTSQGCSSCPPADKVLAELAADPSLDVVTLSFHVDYWNYIGWQDPFSDPRWSARQRRYAEARDSRRVYTPQFLFDGRDLNVGQSSRRAREAIADQARRGLERLGAVATIQGDSVEIDVAIGDEVAQDDAQVYAAVVRNGAVTKVGSGENAKRTLTNVSIVLDMTLACSYEAGGACHASLPVHEAADSVVVWAQSPSSMEVLGVGQTKIDAG